MNSKPVVALPAIEDDLRAAIAHYATWRSDSVEHVLQVTTKRSAGSRGIPTLSPENSAPFKERS